MNLLNMYFKTKNIRCAIARILVRRLHTQESFFARCADITVSMRRGKGRKYLSLKDSAALDLLVRRRAEQQILSKIKACINLYRINNKISIAL